MNDIYPFKLKRLPYDYNSLNSYIDKETVFLHHDKHLKKYVDKLNEALEKFPQYKILTLNQLLVNFRILPESIRNNAGGVYNHNLYFENLKAPKNNHNMPIGKLLLKIEEQYISFENLYNIFRDEALKVFGSGYVWLVLNKNNNLDIVTTKNQDTVLESNLCPIIIIDLWEHAYYLKYKNKRDEYIDNIRNIINWNEAEKRYLECMK